MCSLSLSVYICIHTHPQTHTYAVLCLVAQLCPNLCDPMICSPPGSSIHGDSPGKNTGVGCHALLQGIFPTQESNLGLLHSRQIFYHLSHQGSPWILVAYPFSRGSFQPRTLTRVSALRVDSLTAELPGKPIYIYIKFIHIYKGSFKEHFKDHFKCV